MSDMNDDGWWDEFDVRMYFTITLMKNAFQQHIKTETIEHWWLDYQKWNGLRNIVGGKGSQILHSLTYRRRTLKGAAIRLKG